MSRALRLLGRNSGLLMALGIYGGLVATNPPGPPRLAGPRVVLPANEAKVLAFAPGGRIMLTDGDSGGCLRDVATGRVLRRLVGDDGSTVVRQITYPRFTPDGRRLVVQVGGPRFSDPPRRVRVVSLFVFDVATGRQESRFDRVGADVWFGSALPPPEYALSADGSVLAFCRRTDRSERWITAWDLEAGREIGEFPGSPPLALSPDGGVVAFAETGPDHPRQPRPPALRRIRPARPVVVRIDPVPPSPGLGVGSVAFSNDGRVVATLSANHVPVVTAVPPDPPPPPRLLEGDVAASGRPIRDLRPYSRKGLRFSPDARLVFVDQTGDMGINHRSVTFVWDVSIPTPKTTSHPKPISTSSVAPEAGIWALVYDDGNRPSSFAPQATSGVRIFRLPDPEPRLQFQATVARNPVISPDGRWLALSCDRSVYPQPDLLTRAVHAVLGFVGLGRGGIPGLGPGIRIRDIRLHEVATGRHVATIDWSERGNDPALPLVEFAPDGKTLILSTSPQTLAWSSEHPMIDWSVELWDVPRDGPRRWVAPGPIAGLIVALFIAGLGFDGWRRWRSAATPAPAPV